jgi:hypothetical protein
LERNQYPELAGKKNNLDETYPWFSAGWVFHNKQESSHIQWLSFGKIRYAFGIAGNSPELNYSFHARTMHDMAYTYSFRTSDRGTRSAQQRQVNEKFYHEKSRAHNLGFDLSMFSDRVYTSLDLFHNRTYDGKMMDYHAPHDLTGILYNKNMFGIIQLPPADLMNRGVEASITYKKFSSSWSFELSLNITYQQSKVLSVDPRYTNSVYSAYWDPLSLHLPGEAPGSFFGYKTGGLFRGNDCETPGGNAIRQPFRIAEDGSKIYQQPLAKEGDYIFMDLNGDTMITQHDKTNLGNPLPDLVGGIWMKAQYRRFDAILFLQGTYGNEIFNATKLWLYNSQGTSNWIKNIENSYRSPEYDVNGIMIDPGHTDTDLHRVDVNYITRVSSH